MMAWDGLNRRKFPRVIYPCMIKLSSKDEKSENFLTHTENIGIGGVCIITKQEVKLFTPVELEIDLLDADDHIKTIGKVVWVVRRKAIEEVKPMFYDIGIEFVNLPLKQHTHLEQTIARIIQGGAPLAKYND